jgi:PTS system mannose-specific IID component
VKNDDKKIGIRDLLRVFGRALLLQASWSYDRMQTLGFAYAMEPALRKLYQDQDAYDERLKLHLEYFNTQPYCASFILGAAVRIEEDRASGRQASVDVRGLKTALMAPLGALGDSFFWGALKPFAAVVSAAALFIGLWWAPLLFLVIFNAWHVGLRAAMVFWGYASRGDAVSLMTRYRFTKMARRFKIITLAVLGCLLGMMPAWRPEFQITLPVPGILLALAGLALTETFIGLLRRGGSPIKLMLGLAGVCVALAYAGVV